MGGTQICCPVFPVFLCQNNLVDPSSSHNLFKVSPPEQTVGHWENWAIGLSTTITDPYIHLLFMCITLHIKPTTSWCHTTQEKVWSMLYHKKITLSSQWYSLPSIFDLVYALKNMMTNGDRNYPNGSRNTYV